jgi:hypothetical protein
MSSLSPTTLESESTSAVTDARLFKRCGRGDHVVPVTGFASSKLTHDGLQSWCKDCMRQYSKARHAAKRMVKQRRR